MGVGGGRAGNQVHMCNQLIIQTVHLCQFKLIGLLLDQFHYSKLLALLSNQPYFICCGQVAAATQHFKIQPVSLQKNVKNWDRRSTKLSDVPIDFACYFYKENQYPLHLTHSMDFLVSCLLLECLFTMLSWQHSTLTN